MARNVFRANTVNELMREVAQYEEWDQSNRSDVQQRFAYNFDVEKDVERNKWVARRKVWKRERDESQDDWYYADARNPQRGRG